MKLSRPLHRAVVWTSAGLLLYAIFMATSLPAAWVGWLLARSTEQRVNLIAPTGTIWRGQGAVTINLPGSGPVSLGTLTWDLRVAYVFIAQLRADITLRDGPLTIASSIVRSFNELRLQALRGHSSASQLSGLYPALRAANLQGEIQLEAESLRFTPGGIFARASLLWRNAGSGSFGLDNLGDYRATLSGDESPMRIEIATLRGDVAIHGDGQWDTKTNGDLQLNVTIDPQKRQSSIGPLIQSWAQSDGSGRYRYQIRTALPLPRLL